MYLHLGQDTLVHTEEILGLFDLDTATLGKKTREFLATAENSGRVVNVSTELPKSFVVAGRPKESRVYISQISTATLKKRLEASAL
ncbi:MAG: DUF370 domain-containing protein [Ruminococcaceae bacterium]|nr:DUF370 domain-containing protein [Oscillospiraceae bacterium]